MTARLSILMLIPQLGYGGAEGAFLRLARHLASEADVTIAVMDQPYGEPSSSSTAWTDLPVIRLDDGVAAGGGLMGKARRWWAMLRRLRSLKRRHDVTISFLSGMALSSRLSDSLVAVSRHVQGLLPTGMQSRLLYDPVSAEFLPDDPAPRPPATREFVFLGNYIEGKGQDLALEAFARLLPDVPQARLRFHGGDMGLDRNRAYRRALEARAASLGIAAAVTFGDFAANPRAVLAGAFAALNLSRSESFSRTVLEASACGLPVIATRSGGPAEILVDGETGLMIPVGDVAACAEAMRALCDDPARASRMGAAGRARVLATFAPVAFARALRGLITETS